MSDAVVPLTVIAGFGFVLVVGSRLGAGSHLSLAGLFHASDVREWPQGVQEPDAPQFAVSHADGLRPGQPVVVSRTLLADPFDEPPAEVVELGSRRLDTRRA